MKTKTRMNEMQNNSTLATGSGRGLELVCLNMSKIPITTPLKKATLILAMGLGFIAGCTQPQATHEKTTPGGLTCHISVPEHFNSGTHRLALVLENESVQPIRVCTACGAECSHRWNPKTRALEVGVWLIPGYSEGDSTTLECLAKSIVTLRPSGNVQLPFNVWPDPNSTVRVTAHYAVQPGYGNWTSQPEFQKLDMWRGKIDAEPVTLRTKE